MLLKTRLLRNSRNCVVRGCPTHDVWCSGKHLVSPVLDLSGEIESFSTPLFVCENDCNREGTGLDPHFWRSRNQFSFAVLLAFRKRMTSENGSHYERFALSQQIANVALLSVF